MSNLRITYNYPWLLLLIIPAVLLTLIPYFRLNKRHRFTRNRIISMTLHITAMIIAVNLLAGVGFSYEVPNEENEVILLVDVSDSSEEISDARDAFIRSVVDVSVEDCKIGIVKFGYGCKYAVEMTSDTESVIDKYLLSEDPDGTATALADALKYTASLVTNPKTSKIVVLSDGLETDGEALLVIKDIVSEGIVVDAVPFPKEQEKDIQIVSASAEAENIVVGEDFTANLVINSNTTENEEVAVLRLYDNGELYGETVIGIKNGVNEMPVSLSLSSRGMHDLVFELITDYELFGDPLEDEVANNNRYHMYVNLQEFENILLIEKYENESERLKEIISETKTVTDISVEEDIADFPKTIAEMAKYEQVILVNMAYRDMPAGFEALLNEYVYELGGGLLTVGGRNEIENGAVVPNAYNRSDIENSTYFKQMLPINAEDYTPPVAVMIVVDASYSMNKNGIFENAVAGARACLDALHDRDFCGIMTFSRESNERLSVLPVSQRDAIEEAIKKVEDAGAKQGENTMTNFAPAIMEAGRALSVINNVERKHIILVTDGLPSDSYEDYSGYIEDNVKDGVTMSVVTIGLEGPTKEAEMQKTANAGGGKYYNVMDIKTVSGIMYKDLTQEAIAEIEYGKEFSLTVKDRSPIFTGIDTKAIPTLSGYYGTVAKKGATVPLMGKFVPIYATHKYGNGNVGSFMCDLNGEWSAAFINDVVGKALIMNIVESIFPFEDVRADGIKYELKSDNYSHWLNIHGATELQNIEVSVKALSGTSKHIDVNVAESNRRFTFSITEPGLYEIKIRVFDEKGTLITEIPTYKVFSYSREYDTHGRATENGIELMSKIAEEGRGVVVSDPINVFDGFSKTVTLTYDPRIILLIAAIVLVLLDIVVRKFKFKWIHELIKERKLDRK